MSIRIITDSASDIINCDREDLTVLPLSVHFEEEEYQDGVNLSHEEFYEKLIESDTLPKTSQVAPYAFEEAYQKAKEAGEEVLVLTLASRLSGTCQSACIARDGYEDMVTIVDTENAAIGEHALVEYAFRLKDQGLSVKEIAEILEREKKNLKLVALLDTLEYLKKGGRISSVAAIAGGLLNIKPVITLKDGEIQVLGKARGSKQGNNFLVEQIHAAGGIDFEKPLFLAYSGLSDKLLQKYIKDSEALWKCGTDHLEICTIGGTIGTHAGPGAIAVAFFAK